MTGQIDGTIDSMNPDRVIINLFLSVVISRPGIPPFLFAPVGNDEFNTFPSGNTAVMSFSGLNLDFRACPNGFNMPDPATGMPLQDYRFHTDEGFLITHSLPTRPNGISHVADGTDDLVCDLADFGGSNGVRGCRITETPIITANWSLIVLPRNSDIDPSVSIGSGSIIGRNVEIDEDVVLGENVLVDKNTTIGANTTISGNVVFSKNVDIGSDVTIGSDGSSDQNVLIENGVTIGDFTTIDQGVHVCSGATIGSFVTIGKNNLILNEQGARSGRSGRDRVEWLERSAR